MSRDPGPMRPKSKPSAIVQVSLQQTVGTQYANLVQEQVQTVQTLGLGFKEGSWSSTSCFCDHRYGRLPSTYPSIF